MFLVWPTAGTDRALLESNPSSPEGAIGSQEGNRAPGRGRHPFYRLAAFIEAETTFAHLAHVRKIFLTHGLRGGDHWSPYTAAHHHKSSNGLRAIPLIARTTCV
ncbi:MAG: hypothetical protein HC845_13705 [Akkermansiaceae bacterium]|nr:hypothetical protein [Akkermansiaceae bacterium]